MEVEFRLTPEDLTALKQFHRQHPPVPPKPRQDLLARLLFWVVAGVLVFSIMVLRQFIDDPIFTNLYGTFPGVFVGVVLALLGITLYTKLTAGDATRQTLEQGRNAEKVLGWRRISLEPRALRVETEYSSLTYLWWAVDAIAASPDHAFIYFMTNNAFILPREAFRTDRAFEEFVEAARRYHRMAEVSAEPRERMGEDGRRPTGVQPPPLPGEAKAEQRIVAPRRSGGQPESHP